MIVDAIVKTRNINKNTKRIEIYSPRFQNGKPLMIIGSEHEDKKIKLVTCWSDIPQSPKMAINGCSMRSEDIGKCSLLRGMCVTCEIRNDTIYIVTHESFL